MNKLYDNGIEPIYNKIALNYKLINRAIQMFHNAFKTDSIFHISEEQMIGYFL